MEIRAQRLKLVQLSNLRGGISLSRDTEASPGFLSWCLSNVLLARRQLRCPTPDNDIYENFVNVQLAMVLQFGLQPDQAAVDRISSGPISVSEYLSERDCRRAWQLACLMHAQAALFVHAVRWTNRRHHHCDFPTIAHVGRDCYRQAASRLPSDDPQAQVFYRLADRFPDYSELVNQATVEMNFTEKIIL